MVSQNLPASPLRRSVPIYRKIEAILRDQIFSGELTAGDRVPTEEELGKTFNVSRPTVRQALQILEFENLIVRKAGRGTYVNKIAAELPALRQGIDIEQLVDLRLSGTKVSVQRQGTLAARGEVQAALNVPYGEELFYFIRVHEGKDAAIAGEKVYLPLIHGLKLRKGDLVAEDFLDVLARRTASKIVSLESRIEALLADARTGDLFATPVGSPLISIRRTSYNAQRRPVEHSHLLLKNDSCRVTFCQQRLAGSKKWRAVPA